MNAFAGGDSPASVDRIAEPWGVRTPYASGAERPVRTDVHLRPGVTEEEVERLVNHSKWLLEEYCTLSVIALAGIGTAHWEMLSS
ncbi:hypothetical protein [Streptomyces sp. NPDC057257]|uniref:hypothetical protein n=1 Tax=Streptomyces sp. NPDC057257 TaxID=3346071 RepID=UPI0036438920